MEETAEPWALLPTETVCATCNLAHHKHLPACPTCRVERPHLLEIKR